MIKKRKTLASAIFVLLFILIIYLFNKYMEKDATSIKEFSVNPPSPIVGQSATVKISLSDEVGIKGFELGVESFKLKKTFDCNNETTCDKEFSYTIPNKNLSKVTLTLTILNSENQKTSKKKEITIQKQGKESNEPSVCGDGICDYPAEDDQSCLNDCAFKGPENLFDMNEILDTSTLNTKITDNSVIRTDLGTLKTINVEYYVGDWRGEEIYNTGTIYIPENMPEKNKGKAAIMQGYSKDVQTGENFLEEFAQNTALIFGLPVYSCSCGYPTKPFGYDTESKLSQEYKLLMIEDNDLTRNVVIPLTQDYMRAMTMLGTFAEAGKPTEFVTTGSSKRGNAQWTLAAVDNRVKGFMSNAFSAPDQPNYWKLVKEEFGGENLYSESEAPIEWLETWAGKQYQYYYDPIQFTEKLQKPSITNIGTNDRDPIQSLNTLFLSLDQPKALEFVANYPHGWGSDQHLANWRAIIDRTFFGRKTPIININNLGDTIEASINNTETINKVKLFYSTNYNALSKNLTSKEGVWYEAEMQVQGNNYVVSKNVLPQGKNVAYYIEVEDERNNIQSYSSSIVYIITN
ncbi:MAG: PhoPQ-activated protein PqaA family protein [bacterium]|nr:PhoPQ-activated protein PqaA family protein [bacterium]